MQKNTTDNICGYVSSGGIEPRPSIIGRIMAGEHFYYTIIAILCI
jgi:hypothetical protein